MSLRIKWIPSTSENSMTKKKVLVLEQSRQCSDRMIRSIVCDRQKVEIAIRLNQTWNFLLQSWFRSTIAYTVIVKIRDQ
jgi:hypothetical protein